VVVRKPLDVLVHDMFRDRQTVDDQLQTAGLLQECVMVRDGLAHLPDAFTAGDMSFIACYLCTC